VEADALFFGQVRHLGNGIDDAVGEAGRGAHQGDGVLVDVKGLYKGKINELEYWSL
jgi:hypothetical protein